MREAIEIPAARSGRPALDVARALAEEAGRRAAAAFHQPMEIIVKGRGNLLTETDLAVERYIQDELAAEFPTLGVLSEETAADTSTDGYVWIVDPIDGTKNFASGLPFWCINVALCLDGEPLVAVTHDPIHNETFHAVRGGGAFVNETPIRASDKSTVLASILGLDLGYDDEPGKQQLRLIYHLFPGMQAIRISGSAALGLAYAAAGRFDLFVHRYLLPWDIAAGILLVREAGGLITDDAGGAITVRSQTAIAGGIDVHADFLRSAARYANEPVV
ncbi:MAG: inositol monophosphatase family protein [Dehalococcoidia bacterium]